MCTDKPQAKELSHFRNVFKANGYPKSLVNGVFQRPHAQPTQNNQTGDKESKLVFLPYIKVVSEGIE